MFILCDGESWCCRSLCLNEGFISSCCVVEKRLVCSDFLLIKYVYGKIYVVFSFIFVLYNIFDFRIINENVIWVYLDVIFVFLVIEFLVCGYFMVNFDVEC